MEAAVWAADDWGACDHGGHRHGACEAQARAAAVGDAVPGQDQVQVNTISVLASAVGDVGYDRGDVGGGWPGCRISLWRCWWRDIDARSPIINL